MVKKIVRFFDRLEDKIRGQLSHYPIVYALVGGVGVVFFWRGIWHTADEYAFLTGPVSIVIGTILLLITGVFVSAFIGSSLILTGLRGKKKFEELTLEEMAADDARFDKIENELSKIEKELETIEKRIDPAQKS